MDTSALDTRILSVAEDCVAGFHRRPFAVDMAMARVMATETQKKRREKERKKNKGTKDTTTDRSMLFNRKKYLVTLPETDCHNHLLPKVDDGFDSEAKSLSAISTMAEAGVRHIILTPHVNPEVYPTQNESTQHLRKQAVGIAPIQPQLPC